MRILVATDGSVGSLEAARFLTHLHLTEAHLTVVAVTGDGADAERAAAAAKEVLGSHFSSVETQIRRGNPAEEILKAAGELEAELVVVGSRGLTPVARFILGSVAERVTRHSRCPVLVVRNFDGVLDRVLLGVDGSTCSRNATRFLARFGLPEGCTVELLTVVTPDVQALTAGRSTLNASMIAELKGLLREERREAEERLRAVAAELRQAGLTTVATVRPDFPAPGILGAAEERKADLIVLGAQGMSRFDRFLLGSVSEFVLRHAPCSVLVVRESAQEPA